MEKILIVDDEKNIQLTMATILQDEGYEVFLAANGTEAIEKYKLLKPDVVFLDIWLPEHDGLEVLTVIKELNPEQLVIMISGHGSISAAVKAVKEGAYDFLEKPLSIDKVLFVLKRALEYKKVVEENLRLKSILTQEEEELIRSSSREETAEIKIMSMDDSKNFRKQKTIAGSNIIYGIGIHSGERTGMVIKPLDINKGIRFENISETGYIPARIEFLNSTGYSTCIKRDKLEAKTIEHLMATLHAAGITNLTIKINKEVPIGDGSASLFCNFIEESGIKEQSELIPELTIDRVLLIGEENEDSKFIKIEPFDCFAVEYTCIYPEPLGRQSFYFELRSFDDFKREIAPARTYGFVDEINRLSHMGLAEGGRMNNFILIDKGKVINTELRFPEELPRHKILDIIGDFYLLGVPIRGRITAQKTGHTDNSRMLNLIKETYFSRKK